LIKIIILEENFKWHLEAFASEVSLVCNSLWRSRLYISTYSLV